VRKELVSVKIILWITTTCVQMPSVKQQ